MFYLRFILLVLLVVGFTTALLPKLHLRRSLLHKSTGKLRVSLKSVLPAETTPAIDKYPSQPINGVEQVDNMRIHPIGPDPFKLVAHELEPLSIYIKAQVASENPVLTMAASHFFDKQQGKKFRPTIVSLLARAIQQDGTDISSSPYLDKVLQLGQITEMIHVASLIHDDVLDEAAMRRGGDAVHALYTNKVAVLAGDHLLARASVLLARQRNYEVVEVMADALDALVQGEIMQVRCSKEELLDMSYYLRKSYFKTASLICSSCKSTALLAGHTENDVVTTAAERYGYHLGMAYQIVDDILDFTGASAELGKPAQADMSLGLATAPILYASMAVPALRPYIERRFKQPGDVAAALKLAQGTDCIQESYALAMFHAHSAVEALQELPESAWRDALVHLLHLAVSRKK